ncbi:AAA family ATPase [Paraburkholderia sediminicola]|uniref:AAA family ATPase n=1 Tax=Paraburkholderia sediminicola TaxID=458836 RepID=UPI0038B94E12
MNPLLKLVAAQPHRNLAATFVAYVGDPHSVDLVQRFALEQGITNAVVKGGRIGEAIEHLTMMPRSPSYLIVDVSATPMPLSELERLAAVCEPSVTVIVIGDANDVGLFRNLLEIGVHDYLVKPLTVELLRRSLHTSSNAQPVRRARTGKVIGFAGTRGGVGVTTIAASLARHLSGVANRRIAFIDLNLHGGAANTLLGLKSNNGLLDVLRDADRLDPQFVERSLVAHDNRLFVLSAELPYGEQFQPHERALTDLLERLKPHFHYILLDLPGQGHPLAHTALAAAQMLYLVADASIHSAREVLRLTRHFDSRERAPSLSVLLNAPNAAPTGRLKKADFATATGRNVLLELPFDGAALAAAENLAQPLAPGKSRFGDVIGELANSLSGQPPSAAPRWHARWHTRFTRRRSK